MALSEEGQKRRVGYLQQKRKSFEGQVAKLERYLNGSNPDSVNAKIRLNSLEGLYKEYLKYNDELSQLDHENPQLEIFLEVESRYFEVSSAVNKMRNGEPLANSTLLNTSNITVTERQTLPRLPQIKLPTFDGRREDCAHFKNKFLTLVHNRNDIGDAVKASQLFASVTDQALAKVSHYDHSEEDYQNAWQTLLDFYDQKRIVAVQHLNAILDLPKISTATADGLLSLIGQARQHLHILKRLEAKPSDELVVRILERCLPPATSSRWQDQLEMSELPKLDDLFKFIQKTIFKLQALHGPSDHPNHPSNRKRAGDAVTHTQTKSSKMSARSLMTTAASSSSSPTSSVCPKCDEEHRLFKCPVFNKLAIRERWNLVNSKKICSKQNPIHKTLGIVWDSRNDLLKYSLHRIDPQSVATKRKLLSEISKIFDPLGLLVPVILYAKLLIQECWKAKIAWDESLPQDIYTKWKLLADQSLFLMEVLIPRQILISNSVKIDLHGFCDACNHGYGACLFLRSEDSQGHVSIRLVCSKSRVAPLSGLTIPRLELCAASILKKLYVETKAQFDFPIDQVTFWSDSTIVLCWLRKAPHLLRTFESNRVADIQSLGDQVRWKHIRTEDNPADALSRGQVPSEFVNNSLWVSGPNWLALTESDWPKSVEPLQKEMPGLKKEICLLTIPSCENIYSRFSKFEHFVRVVAYIMRWKTSRTNRNTPLSVKEILEAEYRILGMIQWERFAIELRRLSTARSSITGEIIVPFRKSTRFDEWHPFIGDKGLIRVGGRLKKSDLPYNQRHPILLPNIHPVTDMIIRQTHHAN